MKKNNTIKIDEEFYNVLKKYKSLMGVSMKALTETAVKHYLKHIKIIVDDTEGNK